MGATRSLSKEGLVVALLITLVLSCALVEVNGFCLNPASVWKRGHNSICRSPEERHYLRAKAEDEDEDNDDDDYLDIPEVDVSQFKPPTKMVSFGLNRGRSSPSQRKAMGTSGSSTTTVHVCTNCGGETVKWHGRCPTCKEWNTLQEVAVQRERSSSSGGGGNRPIFSGGGSRSRPSSSWVAGTDGGGLGGGTFYNNPQEEEFINQPVRITKVFDQKGRNSHQNQRTAIPDDQEMTTVLGGGIMKGSLTLLGGTPGVGKSTLLLQTAASVASIASNQGPVWYVSGEETAEQIASRAQRLKIAEHELWLLSETHVDSLAEQIVALMEADATNTSQALFKGAKPPSLLVIDSIQTMICDAGGNSAAGGVTQMRECVALLLRLAKSTGIAILLVGHVTKSGDVAGPRTIEHMVDCVLYLEGVGITGDNIMNLRMLRASKNRFGSSDEVGVYEMTAGRLLPVSDPSSLLLAHRLDTEDSEGCAINVAVEGLRAMTVEIQALVTPCSGGPAVASKRTVNGIAYSRLALLLGVLQKRCGLYFGKQDVYVNVVGSVNLDKSRGEGGSSSDLAVIVALVSSLMSIPVRSDTAFVGEVGLLGELRSVAAIDKRVQEARRMGFSRIVTPVSSRKGYKKGSTTVSRELGIERIQCDTLLAAINAGLAKPLPKRRKRNAAEQGAAAKSSSKSRTRKQETIMDDQDEDDESIYGPEHAQGRMPSSSKPAPGSLQDLNLDEVFMDDYEEDGDSVYM